MSERKRCRVKLNVESRCRLDSGHDGLHDITSDKYVATKARVAELEGALTKIRVLIGTRSDWEQLEHLSEIASFALDHKEGEG